jgi:hypothetical protein
MYPCQSTPPQRRPQSYQHPFEHSEEAHSYIEERSPTSPFVSLFFSPHLYPSCKPSTWKSGPGALAPVARVRKRRLCSKSPSSLERSRSNEKSCARFASRSVAAASKACSKAFRGRMPVEASKAAGDVTEKFFRCSRQLGATKRCGRRVQKRTPKLCGIRFQHV